MNPFKVVQASTDQANALTKILSNKTAQKILESLENGAKTESALAKELSLPLSTIHYNMKQLVKADLVKNDEYTYSEKGREIIHYSLTDQHIVIRTRPSLSIALLQQIIPAILIFCLGLFIFEDMFAFNPMSESLDIAAVEPQMMRSAPVASEEVMMAEMVSDESFESYKMIDEDISSQTSKKTQLLLFSLLSAVIVLISIIITTTVYKFKKN